jgi:hypothetical protein
MKYKNYIINENNTGYANYDFHEKEDERILGHGKTIEDCKEQIDILDKDSDKPVIAFWFSCGAASAVAVKKGIEKYGNSHIILIVNNPVIQEDSDNIRFMNDVSNWIGYPITIASNKNFPTNSIVDVFNKRKYMSGVLGAPCTQQLKKEARYQFEKENRIDFHVLGFTVDELERHNRFIKFERNNVIPVLIDLGLTKNDCFKILEDAGIELPKVYKMGYPNANCIGCVKSQSPTYWNHVRKNHPEVFEERADQSRRLKCKLVRRKGQRIFLDELLPTDKGRAMKSYECGIFCETKLV